MAGVPTNFSAISNVLPNYDFVDIVAGTGIINFFAGNTVDLNLLSNKEFYSELVLLSSAAFNSGVATKQLDKDFDVLINRPLVLKGTTVVNVPIKVYSSQDTVTAYAVVRLRKWNGVAETEICDNQSTNSTAVGIGTTTYALKAVDLNIPLTVFKVGEYLRLTIELWGSVNTGAGAHIVSVGCDPMNRTTTWDATGTVPSKLVFQCPVRLNL